MKLIKIMAVIAVLFVSMMQAKLIVRVDQGEFQEIAAGKTVVNKGPANGTNRYLTDGGDGFYYMYMGDPNLELPTSRMRKTIQVIPEEIFLNMGF